MTNSTRPNYQPLDSLEIGRDSDIATFMRLPRIDDLEHVDIGVFGVPLDFATFRGGTRQGPSAVREASRGIRRTNPRTGVSPFDLCNVADIGDPVINQVDYALSIKNTQAFVEGLRDAGVAPLGIGGDHSTTLPILRGLVKDEPVGLLQFDAHADIQDEFFGLKDAHATLMRRAVEENLVDPKRVVQIGLRGTRFMGAGDLQYGIDAGFTVIEYDDYEEMGRAAAIDTIKRVLGDGPAYVTYDIDGLDPTEAPGTPAREPGGFSMRDSQVILRSLDGLNIVGGDVCEVAPSLDAAGITSLNAANLMFEIVCLIASTVARQG
jgi:guanidinopropionase